MKVCIATTYPEKMHENGMEDALSHSKTIKKLLQGYSKNALPMEVCFYFSARIFSETLLKT